MYEIEKDVLIPSQRFAAKNYPLDKMEVGDSFVVPQEKGGSVQWAIQRYCLLHDCKFLTRKDPKGRRIWRVG